jgi:hypothetical protein
LKQILAIGSTAITSEKSRRFAKKMEPRIGGVPARDERAVTSS